MNKLNTIHISDLPAGNLRDIARKIQFSSIMEFQVRIGVIDLEETAKFIETCKEEGSRKTDLILSRKLFKYMKQNKYDLIYIS